METVVRRAVGKLTDVVREMNEAQRRMLVLQTAMDRHVQNANTAPDTYNEFLVRTSGLLLHEPPARKRLKGRRVTS